MDVNDIVQRFVAVWNEPSANVRRETVKTLWAQEGRHLMGNQDVRGHDALERRVADSHNRNVRDGGCLFRPATAIQALPGIVKFRWDMIHISTGDVAAAGVGFLELGDGAKILRDFLFTED